MKALFERLEESATEIGISAIEWLYQTDSLLPRPRTQVHVRGMTIAEHGTAYDLHAAANIGTILIVDVSGHAAPLLRADRKAKTRRQRADMDGELTQLFVDWIGKVSRD